MDTFGVTLLLPHPFLEFWVREDSCRPARETRSPSPPPYPAFSATFLLFGLNQRAHLEPCPIPPILGVSLS